MSVTTEDRIRRVVVVGPTLAWAIADVISKAREVRRYTLRAERGAAGAGVELDESLVRLDELLPAETEESFRDARCGRPAGTHWGCCDVNALLGEKTTEKQS